MSWFQRRTDRQNWEIATKLALAEEAINQKDKEIGMWKERGDRLADSLASVKQENSELRDLFQKVQLRQHSLHDYKEGVKDGRK